MNMLRLESRLASVMDYLVRLKVAVSRIDTALWPRVTLQNDLESLMTRLNEIPGRVQEWKKSSARCGADVALSLVHVHCKEATRLKKDKNNLNEKMEGIARKRDDLENYLGGLAKKLFVMLEGIFFDPTDLLL